MKLTYSSDAHPHALITGGAKRVGRELALRLADNGYDLSIHYRNSHEEAKSLQQEIVGMGRICRLIQGNLADEQVATNLCNYANAIQPMQPITLLIHNASVFNRDTLSSVSQTTLDAHMRVNLYAPILLTHSFAAQLPNGVAGNVVALVDGMRGWSMSPAFLSYTLSKGALEQFVQLIAPALAPQVRINAIALGATLQGKMDGENLFAKISSRVPLKCSSSVEEVGDALFALLNLPSVTGQILRLSGGL